MWGGINLNPFQAIGDKATEAGSAIKKGAEDATAQASRAAQQASKDVRSQTSMMSKGFKQSIKQLDILKGSGGKDLPVAMGAADCVGCEFGVTKEGQLKVHSMKPLGPAALSCRLAVGDTVVSIDGRRLQQDSAGMLAKVTSVKTKVEQSVADELANVAKSLADGEKGTAVWLEVQPKTGSPMQVCIIREDPASIPVPKSKEESCDESPGGDPPMVGFGIELRVKGTSTSEGVEIMKITEGGAAWLASQSLREEEEPPLMPGDVIFEVDGVLLKGKKAQDVKELLKGPRFSRANIVLKRGQEQGELYRDMVRLPMIDEAFREYAITHRDKALTLPSLPPSRRTNRRGHNQQDIHCPPVGDVAIQDATKQALRGSELMKKLKEAAGDQAAADATGRTEMPAIVGLTKQDEYHVVALCCALLSCNLRYEMAKDSEKAKSGDTETKVSWSSVKGKKDVPEHLQWYYEFVLDMCNALSIPSESLPGLMQIVQDEESDAEEFVSLLQDDTENSNKAERVLEDIQDLAPHVSDEKDAEGPTQEPDTEQEPFQDARDPQDWSRTESYLSHDDGPPPQVTSNEVDMLLDLDNSHAASLAREGTGVCDLPWKVCWEILAISVGSRKYDARARALVRRLATILDVPWEWLSQAEGIFSIEIVNQAIAIQQHAARKLKNEAQSGGSSILKYAQIGGAAVVGGAVIGLTGGLAVPAVISCVGLVGSVIGVGGGLASAMAGVTGLSAVVGVTFGAAGAGLVGSKMSYRLGEVSEFEFDLIDCSPGLPVTIGIPGWLEGNDDSAWKVWDEPLCDFTNDGGEAIALRWESKELQKLGGVLVNNIKSSLLSNATTVVGTAVIGVTFAALAAPRHLWSEAGWIDNSWQVPENRADKAGKLLAQTLSSHVHGHRPVTLIGFGMGSRVILQCLLHLAEMGPKGRGIVETAVCMGTPFTGEVEYWEKASSVVAHRLVNVYCTTDWVLALAYRASSFNRVVAGLAAIKSVKCNIIENIDVTGLVGGHWDYRPKLGELVKLVGLSSGKPPPPSLIAHLVPSITGTLPPVPYLSDVAKLVQDQAVKAGAAVSKIGPGQHSPAAKDPEEEKGDTAVLRKSSSFNNAGLQANSNNAGLQKSSSFKFRRQGGDSKSSSIEKPS